MSNAKNFVSLTGNLTRDPERITDKVVKLGLAVSRSGHNSADKADNTGFFNITYFLNDTPNGKFVASQLDSGKLKKGSGISLVGELRQERWVKDDKQNSTVVVIADTIDYAGTAGGPAQKTQSAGSNSDSESKPVSEMSSDEIPFHF